MADFTITFNELDFVFTDTTDYTALTITKTDLEVKYPPLTTTDAVVLDVYDENVASLGDPFTFTIADEALLDTLVDGVYEFTFVGYNGVTEIFSVTKYYIYSFGVLSCLRTKADAQMDKQCADEWRSDIGFLTGMLNLAERHAAIDQYTQAQEIMDYLAEECNGC